MFISFLRTIVLYLIIVVTLRVLGKRQVGELEPSELVVAILISDLAAVPMQDIGIPLLSGVIPIITLLALELFASELSMRSISFRAFLCGKPVFIVRDGVIDQKAMEKNRLTMDELCFGLRQNGILDVSQVKYAVLETNGQLTTFLYPKYAPLTASDAGKKPQELEYPVTVVSDGRILEENLRAIGFDLSWLRHQLSLQSTTQSDIFLMTATNSGQVHLVKKEAQP
jgi:uncharacterized membrane protein YcaP (DUF421 family)